MGKATCCWSHSLDMTEPGFKPGISLHFADYPEGGFHRLSIKSSDIFSGKKKGFSSKAMTEFIKNL